MTISCLPSTEDLDFRTFLNEEIAAAKGAAIENEDPALNDYAEACADSLAGLASPTFHIDETQRSALVPFVFRALQHGLTLEDLESLLIKVVDSPFITSNDQFLYTFVQLLSLHIAGKLNTENRFQGGSGISGDFDEFAEYIENAELVTGELSIKASSRESLATQGTPCFYNPVENVINVAPFSDAFSTNTTINFTVHESYHAFQYARYAEMLGSNVVGREYSAYSVGDRTDILLNGLTNFEQSVKIFLLELDKEQLGQEMDEKYAECIQERDPIQAWRTAGKIENVSNSFNWHEAQRSALLGMTPREPMRNTFDRFYGKLRFIHDSAMLESKAKMVVSSLRNSGHPEEIEARLFNQQSRIESVRREFLIAGQQTAERARRGWGYSSLLMSVAVMAQTLSRQDVFDETVEIFAADADLIADALLYMPQ